MGLSPGEIVSCRILPKVLAQDATVVSSDSETIVIRMVPPGPLAKGHHLVVTGGDGRYFAEVVEVQNGLVTLRHTWSNARDHFRVDDVLPVVVRRMEGEPARRSAMSLGVREVRPGSLELPDPSVNPHVWRMLVDIDAMLRMVLERLQIESEGLTGAKGRKVNMSASGVRFRSGEPYAAGDLLEVKMLLPSVPPAVLVATGNVVRSEPAGDGEYEIALRFSELDEDAQECLVRYTLQRQREALRRERAESEGA